MEHSVASFDVEFDTNEIFNTEMVDDGSEFTLDPLNTVVEFVELDDGDDTFSACMTVNSSEFDSAMPEPVYVVDSSGSGIPSYGGPYLVEPSIQNGTTLETKDKKLLENITVTEVPQYRTSNTAGGVTVYIGRNVT